MPKKFPNKDNINSLQVFYLPIFTFIQTNHDSGFDIKLSRQ